MAAATVARQTFSRVHSCSTLAARPSVCIISRHVHNLTGKHLRQGVSTVRATIFGAYGFLGRYVTALLAGSGTQCIIPYRGDDMEWRHLKVNGDLGTVVAVPFHPRNEDSIRRAIGESDVVINLIGKDYETRGLMPPLSVNYSFQEVHVDIARRIARIAKEQGVGTLIHLSALSANKYSASKFLRTKAEGELAVRAEAPGATIVRPANMFGSEDRFFNLFAFMHFHLPRVPVVDGGHARVQPVSVQDVARAIHKIAMSEDPQVMLGQTYDLAGPEEYTVREVLEYVFETMRAIEPSVVNLSPRAAGLLGDVMALMPYPPFTRDLMVRMTEDNVLDTSAPTKRFADLGLEVASMEAPEYSFLHKYRTGSHFLDLMHRKITTPQS